MISSLKTRLVLGVGLIAFTAVVTVALAARHGTRAAFVRFQSNRTEHAHRAGVTQARLRPALEADCCSADALREAAARLPDGAGFVLLDDENQVIATAGSPFDDIERVSADHRHGALILSIVRRRGGTTERFMVGLTEPGTPLRLPDGRNAQVYAFPLPLDDIRHATAFLVSLDRWLLLATSFVGLLVVALAWTVSRRIVKPLESLGDAARALARGNLARRVTVRGTDEVSELGRSFNAMAADLERQQMLRRNLLHDVAHELRTPLTALRCRLESVLDGLSPSPLTTVRDLHDEVLYLSRLVDDLQELSRAEAHELRLAITDVPVAAVAESAARAAGLESDPRLTITVDPQLHARADAVRLRQIVLNLLTNAERYTPADGEIDVRARQQGHEVVVQVRNSGSSLDAEQQARVFDRFYRTDPARQRATGGSGLGLAIVKTVVEAHGGRVWVESDDRSVTFSFAVPGGGTGREATDQTD